MSKEKSSIYLFLSVDLVNSTAIKNNDTQKMRFIIESENKTNNELRWEMLFKTFYSKFPKEYKKYLEHENYVIENWKYLGDEILFFIKIDSVDQLEKCTLAFQKTIQNFHFEKGTSEFKKYYVKGTAWTAGFPVINRKVYPDDSSERYDFIGPSIDIGFRLTKFSTPSKLIISIELAHFLTQSDIKIYYSGNHELKGVLNHTPYPIFWLKTADGLEDMRQKLDKQEFIDKNNMQKYIDTYIKQINNPFIISSPYLIDNSDNEIYGEQPIEHKQFINKINEYKNTSIKDPDENKIESDKEIPNNIKEKLSNIKQNKNI